MREKYSYHYCKKQGNYFINSCFLRKHFFLDLKKSNSSFYINNSDPDVLVYKNPQQTFFSLLKDWFPEGWDHRWKNEVQWVKYFTVCETAHDSLPWYWKVSRLTLFSNNSQILNDNMHSLGSLMGLCCQDLRGNTLEYHKQNLSVLKLRSFFFFP